MGVVLIGSSGTNGTTGVGRLEVMTIIETLSTLQQAFIVRSPISRWNTPSILNSFAFSFNVVVDSEMTNPEYSSSLWSSSSTNSCRRANVSASSEPDNNFSDLRWSTSCLFLLTSSCDSCLIMLRNAQSLSLDTKCIFSPNPARCLWRSSVWVLMIGSLLSVASRERRFESFNRCNRLLESKALFTWDKYLS